jgi:hypothetical protein
MIFNVGDIIKNKNYGWYAIILKIDDLYVQGEKIDMSLYHCHRFDCGGYKFDDFNLPNNFIKVSS